MEKKTIAARAILIVTDGIPLLLILRTCSLVRYGNSDPSYFPEQTHYLPQLALWTRPPKRRHMALCETELVAPLRRDAS